MPFGTLPLTTLSLRYHLNRDWEVLSVQRGDSEGDDRAMVGRVILNFVSDRSLRELLGQVFERVYRSDKFVALSYRCDTPELRRYCVMQIGRSRVVPGACLEVENRTVVAEPRPPVRLLDIREERSDEIVTVCSWCKKLRVTLDEWNEVEEGMDRLGLMKCVRLPRLSHGICPPCADYVMSHAVEPGRR